MLRWLRHRNIVQFYGANLELGNMFFVTELMRGGNLYLALRYRPDTMQWDCLGKKVALDIALGLKYLHTRCVVMTVNLLEFSGAFGAAATARYELLS